MGATVLLLVTAGARVEVPMGFLITDRVYYESATTAEPALRPTPPPASHNGRVAPVGGKLRAASSEGLRSGQGGSELRMAWVSAPGEVALGGGRLRFGWWEAANDGGLLWLAGALLWVRWLHTSGSGRLHSG
ncbi:hypothetical protein GUJ93_ZPchr0009g1104 [Zizania palustris]|uniref:Uncharacterized protein n=1 Tax=Zizania palustris TaxID=103762 RepID=A0A8J5V2G6_ZIZPA|nr:hypothetical protein GUJ93_ZPchr0009g1104 [Zizania palustris]